MILGFWLGGAVVTAFWMKWLAGDRGNQMESYGHTITLIIIWPLFVYYSLTSGD